MSKQLSFESERARFLAGAETPNIALQFGPQLVAVGCTRCDREQTPQLVSKPNAGFKDDLRRTTEIECFRYGEQPRSSTANRRAGLIRIAFQIEEASLAKY